MAKEGKKPWAKGGKPMGLRLGEELERLAQAEADRTERGNLSEWIRKAVREKIDRDGAQGVAKADRPA